MNPALQLLLKNDGQYFYGTLPAGNNLGIGRVPIAGGPETLLACGDLPLSPAAVGEGPREDQGSAEFAIAGGYLFWATDLGTSKIVRVHIN